MSTESTQRRRFMQAGAWLCAAPAATALTWAPASAAAAVVRLKGKPAAKPLDAKKLVQFRNALPNPLDPAFLAQPDGGVGTTYALTIRQTTQNLGLGGPLTTVWGYGSNGAPASYPGPTFDLLQNTNITVSFVNALVDANGVPLPNPMPVDTTLDWANPGGLGGLAPVPVVSHLHGGDTPSPYDGLPDAWSTPGDLYQGRLFTRPYLYQNTQEAGHLWYHDHALGITRTNVYMGLAGLYFLRDNNENDLRVRGLLPSHPYEVPIVIQDRQFNADGSLFYPSNTGVVGVPVPSHVPEFFGDVILVNTQAWPVLKVEPRKYRLRLLNGSDSRFYDLKLVTDKGARPGPGMLVIGNELGLLDRPASPASNYVGGAAGVLALAPGERYDVIVDFSAVAAGTRLLMVNSAASPYPAGAPVVKNLTDRVMAFDVVLPLNAAVPNARVTATTPLRNATLTPLLGQPVLPAGVALAARRRILLFEGVDRFGRLKTMLGTVDRVRNVQRTQVQGTLGFKDPITEVPKQNTWEVWEFYNTTVDAHPIHMHLVDFRVQNRQAFTGTVTPKVNTDGSTVGILTAIALRGATRAPGVWEAGRKDTVQAFPGEVTRVLVNFKRTGEYVYHCHILSHEDHEMMRPYQVVV